MKTESSTESSRIETAGRAAFARKARFGTLPARIHVESMIVEQPAYPPGPH